MRSRQQAKLNSQRAQKAPIEPAPRTGPRRQLPPSGQGGNRVGNSSQPWGQRQGSGQDIRQVRVREVPQSQLPGSSNGARAALPPGKPRPQRPGTSKVDPTRREMAEAKLKRAAQGSTSSEVRLGNAAKVAGKGAKFLKIAGSTLGIAGETAAAIDQARKVFNPKDNLITRMSDLGTSVENAVAGGRKSTYTNNDYNAKRNAAVKADNLKRGYSDLTTDKNPPSRFAGARDSNMERINNDPRFAAPKSPAKTRPSSSSGSSSSGAPAPARTGSSRPSSSTPAPSKPAAPAQSKSMDQNYAAWAQANQGLAAKVKKGQAGYDTIQKTLDKLKIKGKK